MKVITAKNGIKLILNKKNFYIDGTLENDDAENFKFKTLHSAIASAADGTESEPMTLYIEPNVYHMMGTLKDRGLYVDKDWVSFIGLSSDPKDIVIADNRGHTIGADPISGFSPAETIFITGTGFHAENLTFGNYCNVDLVYQKDTSKNQLKRSDTITQAYCIGAKNNKKTLDKFFFKNVHFISMLDTLHIGSVQRAYFEDCYLQGTDDYIGGCEVNVFKNTTLHCYSGKPIYCAAKEGTAFINCKWNIDFKDKGDLTLAKNSSTLYLINCSFADLKDTLTAIKWTPYPSSNVKCYSYNNNLNCEPYDILPEDNSIKLTEEQLKAYSSFNLLKSSDDWDPGNEKDIYGANKDLPVNIYITKEASIRTGENTVVLEASVFPHTAAQNITWSIDCEYATLNSTTGTSVVVEGKNNDEKPAEVVATATAVNGISNKCIVTVYPPYIDAPKFIKEPYLTAAINGTVTVNYSLDFAYSDGNREDESIITWYRCNDISGSNPVKVSVQRCGKPLCSYTLTTGDINHYIAASVLPKHLRSYEGKAIYAVSERSITLEDIVGAGYKKFNYSTSFENFPTDKQPKLLDGTWSVDAYYPSDQMELWTPSSHKTWEYTRGINGAADCNGLLTVGRGARLLYTQDGNFEDMAIHLTVNPEKTSGQGFGSPTSQYLEIYIKYNTKTKTGYGLRIERTTKYGFATDFTLYKYENGTGYPISNPISTTAFNPGCNIDLWVENDILYAKATSTTAQSKDQINAGLPEDVSLSAEISVNTYGGMGILHTGTVSSGNRTQLRSLSISYK